MLNLKRGSPIRPERKIGLDTELWTDSESGVGIDVEANADSAAKYNSEAGWGARLESDWESELRKSDSARARNRAGCGIGNECVVDPGHTLRGSRGIRSR